jgi:hypothetical protein
MIKRNDRYRIKGKPRKLRGFPFISSGAPDDVPGDEQDDDVQDGGVPGDDERDGVQGGGSGPS